MDSARWQRLSAELDALLDADASARAARLADIARQDPALATELAAMLAQDASEGALLDTPLLQAAPGPAPGEQVGMYRLLERLGEGGMGQVWVAERADGLYQRQVALKLLRPGFADPNLRLRFTRERQILARLAHPHIARLLDAGISENGQPYLALEKVSGEGILGYCQRHALPLRKRLHLFRQVCEAVSHAHANLVVHRDLKPSNILVTAEGKVQLLDFGIAKLLDGNSEDPPEATRTGVRSFTLHYAAPEQIRGEPVTTQTDVYALGVVLFELLTGNKPYRPKRASNAQWEEAILASDPQRPSASVLRGGGDSLPRQPAERKRWARQLTGDLDNIVLKALAKQPAERYPSAEALSLDIQRYLDGLPVLARPQSLGYRLHKFLRRQRWPVFFIASALGVLLALLALVWSQRQQAVRETARAQALQDFVITLFEGGGVATAGKPLEVATLVAAGERRGERELAQQPRAHAELLGVMARIRIALGEYDKAAELLRQQSALLAQLGEVPDALQLDALTQRGRLQRLQGRSDTCIHTLQPMLPRARAAQAQLPARVADYYSHLARCLQAQGQREAARRLFEQSLSLRRSVLADDVGVVENLTDLATLAADGGHSEAAWQGFRGALAQLHRIAGQTHPLAIDILRALSTLEYSRGQLTAATASTAEALALSEQLQGPEHPDTLSLALQYARYLLASQRPQTAATVLAENQPRILQRYGKTSPEASEAFLLLAQAHHARGEFPKAQRAYLDALRGMHEAPRIAQTLLDAARMQLDAGQPEAAWLLTQQAGKHLADTPHALTRLRAAIRLQQGQYAAARALLQNLPDDDADAALLGARLAAADPHRRAEDVDAARVTLEDLAQQPVTDTASLARHIQALAALAGIQCRQNPAAGLAAYTHLQQRLDELYPEGSPYHWPIARERRDCAGE